MSQLLTQIQDLQNKGNSLSDAREFYDPETARSSGASHVPGKPLTIPSPRTMPSRDSGLPHDTRNAMGASGNVFESLLARDGPSSALFENSRNSRRTRCCRKNYGTWKRGETRAAELATPTPRFDQGTATLNPSSILEELVLNVYDGLPETSDLGNASCKFPGLIWNFKAGKSTSRLKYVQNEQLFASQCTG